MYRILEKATTRIDSRNGFKEPDMDVTYVAELSEDALRSLILAAHRSRAGIAVGGPVRVRILKREPFKP